MQQSRDQVWEYLKAFTLLVLLIDHCVHAYGQNFNLWHFIADKGTSWADYFYLYDNNIVTPMLFFLLGLYVIPSFYAKGASVFFKELFCRWGIPWLIGIPLILPLLSFPRFLLNNPDVSFFDFISHIYFPHRMQGGGPFWILWYAFFLTTLSILLDKYTPLIRFLRTSLHAWNHRPYAGTLIFILLVGTLYYLSDLYYGPYHWIGFVDWLERPLYAEDATWFYHILKLFRVQGSKYLIQGLFFMLGVALGSSALITNSSLKEKWMSAWKPLLLASFLSFGAYATYMGYILESQVEGFQDLYNDTYSLLLKDGYEGPRVFEAFKEHLFMAGPRLFLQGICLVLTALAWIACFQRFFRQSRGFFKAYSPNSYGIFLLHEVPVIWMQYFLISSDLPTILKILAVLIIGLCSSWLLTALLRKSKFIRKIL